MRLDELQKSNNVFRCAYSPYAKDFGTRYDLGDMLIVYLTEYGLKIKSRVIKFTQKSQGNQINTTIEVGEIEIMR
jgi:hypothetical protein